MLPSKSLRQTRYNRYNSKFQSALLVIVITILIIIASIKAHEEGIYFKRSDTTLFLNKNK
jgi:hypothetical protein